MLSYGVNALIKNHMNFMRFLINALTPQKKMILQPQLGIKSWTSQTRVKSGASNDRHCNYLHMNKVQVNSLRPSDAYMRL